MKILHVHSGNLYGGVETILVTLARRKEVCPDVEHEFALCFDGRLNIELASLDVPVYSIGAIRVSRPLTVLRGRQKLRNLLIQRRYDALVFHSAWSHAIFAPVACDAEIPAVVWMHGTTGGKHWSEKWAGRTDPEVVICNSHFTAAGAAAVYPKTRPHVLYCPLELSSSQISLSERNEIRRILNTPEDAVVIAQVSRMEPCKGHFTHLEALSMLRDNPAWKCWLVGGPQRPAEEPYFSDLRSTASRLGIEERVLFLNERADVPKLLRAADIYCQPNLQPESFGITLVEALNAGLPVVTAHTGGANEVIDDTCGMLVPPGDAATTAGQLRRLIEDVRLRKELGERGPARASELCDPNARIRDFSCILAGAVSL
jgi:glycosyltransferase involved in cell wall biosynthesis